MNKLSKSEKGIVVYLVISAFILPILVLSKVIGWLA